MSLLFLEGFDIADSTVTNDDAQMARKWTEANGCVYSSTACSSPQACYMSSGSYYISKRVPFDSNGLLIGGCYSLDLSGLSTYGLVQIQSTVQSSGTSCHLTILAKSDGSIEAWLGDYNDTLLGTVVSAGTIEDLTYFQMEVKYVPHATSGVVEVHINGTQEYSYSGNTLINDPLSNSLMYVTVRGDSYLDNFYILSCDSTSPNTFIGEAKIITLNPDGAGNHTDFTPSTGSNYDCVNNVPYDLFAYSTSVSSSTLNDIDTYTFGNTGESVTVHGVAITISGERDEPTERKVTPVIRMSSTDYEHATPQSLPPADPAMRQFVYNEAPDSTSWDVTKINALEAGPKIKV